MTIPVLAVALLLALAIFGIAAAAVGRLPGLVPAESDNEGVLPEGELTADDLPRVRFSMAIRGYRMSEVDAFVDRVRAQLTPIEDDEAWSSEPVAEPDPEPSSPSSSPFAPPPS